MKANLPIGIVSILLGLYYAISAFQLPRASMGDPMAPVYYPMVLGVGMICMGIVLSIRGYKEVAIAKQSASQSESADQDKKADSRDKNFWILILGAVILGIVYTLVFTTVGFLISTALFMFALFTLVNGFNNWLKHVIIAVVFSVSVWFIFQNLFMLNLP